MLPTAPRSLMIESFRWYGPRDTVTLAAIRQCGATGIFTALHEIPYGEVWPWDAILERKSQIEQAGLRWVAAEPVPVSESIKSQTGDYARHLENYCLTLRHLARAGVEVVLNCFMPVLEWVRTDLARVLPDGKQCLSFNPIEFAAFELFLLKRSGAEADYTPPQLAAAEAFFSRLSPTERTVFGERICGMLPGFYASFSLDQLRERLAVYQSIDDLQLRKNLQRFLEVIVPVAEEVGIRLAMHPDDPPFPILGLPRIVSTADDIEDLYRMVPSQANGLCLCTGSFGCREDNDLVDMVHRFGDRIHAVHLRNVQREGHRAFFEADHLGGSVAMPAVVRALLHEQWRRQDAGRSDWQLAFRPDHGHVMLDDLDKPPVRNPGYTCLGRMRGLAEIRGLQHALAAPSSP